LCETDGYDRQTATILRLDFNFLPVPESPTQEDAQAAANRLLEPFADFPFASDGSKAVLLSAILCSIARPGIDGPVPGIAVIGNSPGCGKQLMIDSIGVIATGREIPTSNYPDDPTEAAKVRVATAIEGCTLKHLDNVENGGTYGNSALDSALTTTTVNDRILGQSRNTGPLCSLTLWFLSGNGITPSKDAFRRWLPLPLRTDLERPEERRDIKILDLKGYLREHRAELVRDALTILRAHFHAGRPVDEWGPLGSYYDWDRIIRGAVWWAAGLDCCETREAYAEESPERLAKLALLEGWCELPDGYGPDATGVTIGKALELVSATPTSYPGLAAALVTIGRGGKVATPHLLGAKLKELNLKNLGGKRFQQNGQEQRAMRWRVVPAAGEAFVPLTPKSGPLHSGWRELCESNGSDSLSSGAALTLLRGDQLKHRELVSSLLRDGHLPSAKELDELLGSTPGFVKVEGRRWKVE
jgi:hypothetical protein